MSKRKVKIRYFNILFVLVMLGYLYVVWFFPNTTGSIEERLLYSVFGIAGLCMSFEHNEMDSLMYEMHWLYKIER